MEREDDPVGVVGPSVEAEEFQMLLKRVFLDAVSSFIQTDLKSRDMPE